MKTVKNIVLIVLFLSCSIALWSWKRLEKPVTRFKAPDMPTVSVCGSFPMAWNDTLPVADAKIIDGLGNLHYPITTTSLKAQEFFEQGLRLIYAFNHWEAIQAFRTATVLDPDCAMAYWGLALAFGPNLNDWNPQDRERFAFLMRSAPWWLQTN